MRWLVLSPALSCTTIRHVCNGLLLVGVFWDRIVCVNLLLTPSNTRHYQRKLTRTHRALTFCRRLFYSPRPRVLLRCEDGISPPRRDHSGNSLSSSNCCSASFHLRCFIKTQPLVATASRVAQVSFQRFCDFRQSAFVIAESFAQLDCFP